MPYLLLNSRMILHRLSEWFPDSRNELVVVTAHSALAGTAADISGLAARFRHLAVVDDYRSPNLEQQVIRLCREHRVERLMTLGENDIVRAARLREALRLPGQELLSAIAYRDKFVMKTLAAAAGIRVAPMRLVTDGKMLRDFAGEVGLPVVVKPLDGGGGMGICVVHDGAALDTYTREWHHARLNFPRLAEAWVEGDFYQVNGLMHAGRVKWSWPSRNLHPDLATLTWGAPGLSGMLPREHPLFGPLLRATADTVAALPPAPEVRPLHAEFFHSADRGLVLCEIACRAGGGAIVETHERAFSVNLHEAGLKGQAGLLPKTPSASDPARRHGFAWFPPLDGILTHLPASCPLSSTVRYLATGAPGLQYELPQALGPHVAQLVFTLSGPDVVPELRQIQSWWDRGVSWQLSDSRLMAHRPSIAVAPSSPAEHTGGAYG